MSWQIIFYLSNLQGYNFLCRPAFAMTINKSQGQHIRSDGILYLPKPVFVHGQLNVALTRVLQIGEIYRYML